MIILLITGKLCLFENEKATRFFKLLPFLMIKEQHSITSQRQLTKMMRAFGTPTGARRQSGPITTNE